ncbi:MAG: ABC-F family ATP-binding cassette domain-containing protein [Cyclobacteriaceae bacterium]|nr:ABC-F family ATP-binding cassette domain-containing protein [Cyclobacteriaceae bacterium]
MLSINNLTYHIGGRSLYRDASLHINERDKVGLVGINGSGKTTLLKIILGELKPDQCDISIQKGKSIDILTQEIGDIDEDLSILTIAMQAFQSLIDMKEEMDRLAGEIAVDHHAKKIEKLSSLQTQFEINGGYAIQSKAEGILEGIGFKTDDLLRPMSEFSGGWKMRVILSKLLLEKPSLLLLDEPTNHLDLPSIRWFENYIRTYEGSIIIVSHDRQFLDNTVNKIVDIEDEKLILYKGNYSFYMEEKTSRAELQQNAHMNQQKKIREAEKFINRFRAKASKARQVQSRIKLMDKIELIENSKDSKKTIDFEFRFEKPSGKQVLEISGLSKSYGPEVIFSHTSSQIIREDKIALIGANGMGKTTLLKIIAGGEEFSGTCSMGFQVIPAYYAQHQIDALDYRHEVLQELILTESGYTELELRTVLGSFLFSGDDVYKKIGNLSGGEKSRVALAKTLISKANFLILDEPTNHLDMYSVDILSDALAGYKGTLIMVSHDRDFINNVANKIWYIENRTIKEYPGTLDEYLYWMDNRSAKTTKPAGETKTENKGTKEKNMADYQEKKELKRKIRTIKKDIESIEEKIHSLETDKQEIEYQMAIPANYADFEKLNILTAGLEKINLELDGLHRDWEVLVVSLDDPDTAG